ncbi:MAG TPA: SIS domain-containing protein [Cycloclasticus sp.]|nr:SIS domain-containing protein [Cycloclasticus sp.]HIL91987.1 SIS domain-containing protein [Cycloclasticus sp.]
MNNGDNNPLQNLYPFLHGQKKDAGSENNALLDSIQIKAAESIEVKSQFFAKNNQALIDTAQAIATTFLKNGRLFTMGNGGSSCDASHLAVEFQHPVTAGRQALPAINLCIDTAMISAVSNDVGVKHVFARQLDAHAQSNDALVGFSTSGHSANLIAAFNKAKQIGLTTIGFVGADGGEMRSSGLLDHCLVVESDSIHRVQETHVACYHILWDLVHTLLADQRGLLGTQNGEPT